LHAKLGPLDGLLAGLGLAVALLALSVVWHGLRRRDLWVAVAGTWAVLAGLYVGVIPTGEIVQAIAVSPKPLVERIVAELPRGAHLTVQGVGDDPSLLLLFYFPAPEHLTVVPEAAERPTRFAPGYYLFSGDEWSAVASEAGAREERWREVLRDVLPERGGPRPVVLAERLPA
jgi:hypothetical protein